ncbi:MAG: prepilin-type N-terminal cleavage/methylation domain-containing protein [Microgenomates group bacterium]|jgi:type II secretory pathway pseudopilin PulG
MKKQKGFTLVEMLIYMGLMAGFLLVLTDVLVAILDVKAESAATSSVQTDGRFITARLAYDVALATSISQPATLGASGGTLTMVVGGNTYTYSLNGTNLQLVNNLGTNNLNSSESQVSGLTFQRLGNTGGKDTIKVTYTLTSATTRVAGSEVRTFTTTVGRR